MGKPAPRQPPPHPVAQVLLILPSLAMLVLTLLVMAALTVLQVGRLLIVRRIQGRER